MPQPRLTVVVSQGQSHNPAKRKLEEDVVGTLLGERGIEVMVVPNLYDLAADGTGTLCLQGVTGDMVVLSWLYPRAAHWILNRNDIRGHAGTTLLVADEEDEDDEDEDEDPEEAEPKDRVLQHLEIPNRKIYCLDLRVRSDSASFVDEIKRIAAENSTETVELNGWISGNPKPEQMQRFAQPAPGNVEAPVNDNTAHDNAVVVDEDTNRRWYPVIDFSRCTNCLECIDFCLFGVYGIDSIDTILVEQPDNCRKGCPACSRVCPENAIIFPQHKTPAIAGSEDVVASLKIDLSKLFGARAPTRSTLRCANGTNN